MASLWGSAWRPATRVFSERVSDAQLLIEHFRFPRRFGVADRLYVRFAEILDPKDFAILPLRHMVFICGGHNGYPAFGLAGRGRRSRE